MFVKFLTEYQLLSNLLSEDDDLSPQMSQDSAISSFKEAQEYNLWNSKGFAPGRNIVSKTIGLAQPSPFPPKEKKIPLPIGAEVKMRKAKKSTYSSAVKHGLKMTKKRQYHDEKDDAESVTSGTESSSGSDGSDSSSGTDSSGSSILEKIVVVVPNECKRKNIYKKKKNAHAPPPVAPTTPKIGEASKFAVLKNEESQVEEGKKNRGQSVNGKGKEKKLSKKARRSSCGTSEGRQESYFYGFITMLQMLLIWLIAGCTFIHDKVEKQVSSFFAEVWVAVKFLAVPLFCYAAVLYFLLHMDFIGLAMDQNTFWCQEIYLNQWVFEQLHKDFVF